MQQNKLAAAGRARTSVAPQEWDRLTWPAQWWVPAPPRDYLATWGCIQQQTRIAQRAAHHPSKTSGAVKMQANNNETEGPDERTNRRDSEQSERSVRDGYQASGRRNQMPRRGKEVLYCLLCACLGRCSTALYHCTSVMVCQATCPRFPRLRVSSATSAQSVYAEIAVILAQVCLSHPT